MAIVLSTKPLIVLTWKTWMIQRHFGVWISTLAVAIATYRASHFLWRCSFHAKLIFSCLNGNAWGVKWVWMTGKKNDEANFLVLSRVSILYHNSIHLHSSLFHCFIFSIQDKITDINWGIKLWRQWNQDPHNKSFFRYFFTLN